MQQAKLNKGQIEALYNQVITEIGNVENFKKENPAPQGKTWFKTPTTIGDLEKATFRKNALPANCNFEIGKITEEKLTLFGADVIKKGQLKMFFHCEARKEQTKPDMINPDTETIIERFVTWSVVILDDPMAFLNKHKDHIFEVLANDPSVHDTWEEEHQEAYNFFLFVSSQGEMCSDCESFTSKIDNKALHD